jgi:hypothetical protein
MREPHMPNELQWRRRKRDGGRWTKLNARPTEFDHDTYMYEAHGHREGPEPGPEAVFVQVPLDDFPEVGYTTSVEIRNTETGPRITFIGVGMKPTPIDDQAFPWYTGIVTVGQNESGVTARLLKQLNHTAILKEALKKLHEEEPSGVPSVDEAIAQITDSFEGSRTQRRDDRFKARLAAAYVAQVAETGGRGVYQELAERLNYSESTLRSYVAELRTSGFLSAGRAGAAGGELTDKTKTLLDKDGGQ